jgi:hypothetical protein
MAHLSRTPYPKAGEQKASRGRFRAGQSGNLKGRPKGALNKTTLAAQAILDGEGEALTRKAVELAKGGNAVALRLCLERLLPPRKDRPVSFALPKVAGTADIAKVLGAILVAVAQGEITPGEGQSLAAMLEGYRKGLEMGDLEARMTAVEEKIKDRR